MGDALTERVWRALTAAPCGRIEDLATQLQRSPEQVLAELRALRVSGVDLQLNSDAYVCSVPPAPLTAPERSWLGVSECWYSLDSTQDRARQLIKSGTVSRALVVAEQQAAGRGRCGRRWSSPLGAHLYLSCCWRFSRSVPQLAGLSLLVGLALRRALQQLGIQTQLKWPNDVLLHGRKLAGVLIELIDQAPGCVAVIGIGLNHRMPIDFAPDQPWIDLAALGAAAPSRQRLLDTLLDILAQLLEQFDQLGFAGFAAEFDAHHVLAGELLPLAQTADPARVMGVDAQGRLGLLQEGALTYCDTGEIQLPRARLAVPWRLLIDCGNTRLKWAWSPVQAPTALLSGPALALHGASGELLRSERLLDDLQTALAHMQIDSAPEVIVMASSFGGDRLSLQRVLEQRIGAPVQVVESPAHFGTWVSAYANPAALGIDRSLAMWALLAQLHAAQRVLLVSLGTAMTLDVLDGQGRHHGGLIAAAPALQRRVLAELSARLQVHEHADHVLPLAASSSEAVASASVWMAVALIEKVARTERVDAIWCSGGALLDVLPWLQPDVAVHIQPDLALRGLALCCPDQNRS